MWCAHMRIRYIRICRADRLQRQRPRGFLCVRIQLYRLLGYQSVRIMARNPYAMEIDRWKPFVWRFHPILKGCLLAYEPFRFVCSHALDLQNRNVKPLWLLLLLVVVELSANRRRTQVVFSSIARELSVRLVRMPPTKMCLCNENRSVWESYDSDRLNRSNVCCLCVYLGALLNTHFTFSRLVGSVLLFQYRSGIQSILYIRIA